MGFTRARRARNGSSVVALALIGVVSLAGCAASPSAGTARPAASTSPVTAATPTLPATPSPASTPDIEAMGSAYLAFGKFLREMSTAINEKLDNSTSDAETVALYAEAVALDVEAVARLAKLELPVSLEADRAKMIAALEAAATEFGKLAADPSYDPGDRITDANTAVGVAGANIREALGLPPPPETPKP